MIGKEVGAVGFISEIGGNFAFGCIVTGGCGSLISAIVVVATLLNGRTKVSLLVCSMSLSTDVQLSGCCCVESITRLS